MSRSQLRSGRCGKGARRACGRHTLVGLDDPTRRKIVEIGRIDEGDLVQIEIRAEKVVAKLEVVAVDEFHPRPRSVKFVRVRRWRKFRAGREHPDYLGDIASCCRSYDFSRPGSPSLISEASVVKNGVTGDCECLPGNGSNRADVLVVTSPVPGTSQGAGGRILCKAGQNK